MFYNKLSMHFKEDKIKSFSYAIKCKIKVQENLIFNAKIQA